MSDKAAGRVLLPDHAVPIHYDVKLIPDLEKFTFAGEEQVTMDVKESKNFLELHVLELAIKTVSYTTNDGKDIACTEMSQNFKLKTLKMTFKEDLPVGEGTLNIAFEGVHNNQMAGFYRSSYNTVKGEKRIMISTQVCN